MPSPQDIHYLQQALQLATQGRGHCEPNPMVACIIVKNDQVIGEGYHALYGGPHAEPNALAACTQSPEGATAYVTLEPCCHTNKQTPPCAPRLIQAKVKRVVIGCFDPNPDVNGKGVAMLRQAGIEVDGPVLEAQAKQLIAPFIARIVHNRPYITLKWAQTADDKVAGPKGRPLQITNRDCQKLTHELRSKIPAILVGVNTVLTDDPILNARYATTPRHPHRFVLDRTHRTPASARILTDPSAPTTLLDAPTLNQAIEQLHALKIHELFVEPGPTLASAFFAQNLCDRLWILQSPQALNDSSAPNASVIPPHFIQTARRDLQGDTLTEYLNTQSPVYFAPEPSVDLPAK